MLLSVPLWFRKEEAALNKFHHLRRKVAAAQWLTPLIDAALIMIIACLSCCCSRFSLTLCHACFSAVFHILPFTGAGVLQMFGCLPSTPCNLLAANQQPPLHYCSDTSWNSELNWKLSLQWVPGNLQIEMLNLSEVNYHLVVTIRSAFISIYHIKSILNPSYNNTKFSQQSAFHLCGHSTASNY